MTQKILSSRILVKYKKKQKLYSDFALAMQSILEQLLKGYDYKYTFVSSRAKDLVKLKEKIERKEKEGKIYKKLEDIEDLAGVRVIFYLESDRKKFLEALNKEFGGNAKIENEDKESGYKATHVILSLDKKRSSLAEYKKYNELKCEVQLTSIFYHAWSELEHDIIYKKDKNLKEYTLEKLKDSFASMMEHVMGASMIADHINSKYLMLKKASEVVDGDIVKRVSKSSNDEIYEILQLFEDLEYKNSDDVLLLVKSVLDKKPSKQRVMSVFGTSKMYGKKHEEIVAKSLNLLNFIRYSNFIDEILKIAFFYSKNDNKLISSEAIKIIIDFSKYDYFVLVKTKIGLGCQRKILDYILLMNDSDKINYLIAIKDSVKELLKLSFRGMDRSDVDKYTMHSGHLPASEFLSKIRQDSINLVFSLIENVPISEKLDLIKILSKVSRMPHDYDYGSDTPFCDMVRKDLEIVIAGFDNLLFGEDNLAKFPGLILEIDSQLYWYTDGNNILKNENAEKLKKRIYLNDSYNFFISIIGDRLLTKQDLSWSDSEKKKADFINQVVENVSKSNLKEWIPKFNMVAEQLAFVEYWQFSYFNRLLQKIAQEKPEVAFEILNKSFSANLVLANKNFLSYFLDGLRLSGRVDLWDSVVKIIIESANHDLIPSIFYSFGVSGDYSEGDLRNEDIRLFSSIIYNNDLFLYINRNNNDGLLSSSVISGLCKVYKANPSLIEKFIIDEIIKHGFAKNIYLSHIATGVVRGELDFSNFSSSSIRKIIKWFVGLDDLNWEAQDLLLKISNNKPSLIVDLMIKRIEKDIKDKSKKNYNAFAHDNYEPIPYHFNAELVNEIKNHPGIESSMFDMVIKSDDHWSLYNWHVGQFLSKIGGPSKEALIKLVRSDKKSNLKRAVSLIDHFGQVDIDLCLEIVKRTDDKNILSSVEAALSSTGVVSGLYGMADAYENKSKMLENFLTNKNKRISKFAKNFSSHMLEDSKRERRRASEEEKRRKIEYEN
jgi:ppGpp synthetase/RelA/SpoT-type nucleotidyltranferase